MPTLTVWHWLGKDGSFVVVHARRKDLVQGIENAKKGLTLHIVRKP